MMTVIGYRVFLMVGLLFCSGAVVRVLTQTNNIIPATAWKQSGKCFMVNSIYLSLAFVKDKSEKKFPSMMTVFYDELI